MELKRQRVVLAETEGWTQIDSQLVGYAPWAEDPNDYATIPEYHLDDIHRFEEKCLTADEAHEYCEILSEKVNNGPPLRWGLTHATAAHKREALLRTLGKWEKS